MAIGHLIPVVIAYFNLSLFSTTCILIMPRIPFVFCKFGFDWVRFLVTHLFSIAIGFVS